ncbi:Neopullulanase 2 [bioreactor metagenome]|uniref:Neopullulanase 2 n=1 Tax=bioreactor metagenome TaxID=1076179 RepID=A0A645EEP4_9ZZZZ
MAADLGYSKEFNHKFWKEFRKKVKEAYSDAIIIAEHYGDASKWLEGDEWDTVMNYDAFMEPVSWFFTGMEKHSDRYDEGLLSNGKAFEDAIKQNSIKMGFNAANISMNELSNHDHSRFLTRTNRKVGRLASAGANAASEGINFGVMREAVIFQFVWAGIPTIYYGDEAGVAGWTDPDNRRTYPWEHENKELLDFHKEIIKIRKNYQVLSGGSCRFIHSEYGAAAIARFDDNNCVIAVFNNLSEKRNIRIPVWLVFADADSAMESVMESIITSDIDGYDLNNYEYEVVNGFADIEVGAYGSVILKNK